MYFIFFLIILYAIGALGTISPGMRTGGRKIPMPPKHLDPNYKKRKR
jgi:hypothetical protein